MKYHEPVMFDEVITYLAPDESKSFIDCTLGDGGHTLGLLEKGSRVLGLDMNEEGIKRAQARINQSGYSKNFFTALGNFEKLEEYANRQGFSQVHGILFDLGFSQYELDEGEFGLSFLKDTPLDMRFDKSLHVTAADLVNSLPRQQIEEIIREYGGERYAKRISEEIVKFRVLEKFHSTKQLADVVKNATFSGYEHGRLHPATRTFQALRIAVNNEIDNLQKALPQAARLLLPGGRMVIISYHSLEDKIAKAFGNDVQPIIKALLKKPLCPTEEEVLINNKARSAKMRIYERI